ncbi:hypothetical protein CANINC_000975 [Pichia inconspicua]|uniref:RING-type domain-containing protein n=1 Tax=Pichia inconspicua TaxID=52247 RepID=A0A4T0X6J0_9ASCO|nr:hypothetical protein CANINC_000975 [[Candida] inconspicua]
MVTDVKTGVPVSPARSFDQRLSSDLSQAPLNPPRFLSSNYDKSSSRSISFEDASQTNERKHDGLFLEWLKLSKISELINSTSFKQEHGSPKYLTVSDAFIAIATTKRHIILFNYAQSIIMTIESKNIDSGIEVTAMALSIDSTYLLVGYSSGHINLWDLKTPEPIITIRPVNLAELQFNGKHHHIAHYENTPIRKVSFVGPRHTSFLSSDDSGMLLSHKGGRSLVGFYCRSTILYGEYKTLKMGRYEHDKDCLLDFDILPVGSVPSPTDDVTLVAILTLQKIIVLSLYPSIRQHFMIPSTTLKKREDLISGHLEWYPSIRDDDETANTDASLVFSWSNDIQVARIKPKLVTLEGNSNELVIQYSLDVTTTIDEPSVSLKWINNRSIAVLSNSQKLVLLNSKSLNRFYEIDLKAKNIPFDSMMKNNNIGIIERSYLGSMCTYKSSVFMFQNGNIMLCRMKNWADILLEHLNQKDYISALSTAKNQYEGDTDLVSIGLPENANKRHNIMKGYLEQIMRSSIKYIFNPAYECSLSIIGRLNLFFKIALMLDIRDDIYDMVLDILTNFHQEDYFFEALQELILNGTQLTLSPSVLNAMISFFIDQQDISTLEKLICNLDVEKLNVDMVVTLCQKYHLNETLAYIWAFLFKDYLMPLKIAIQRIMQFYDSYHSIDGEQRDVAVRDIQYVYSYLSYILTGRQFPTEKKILEEESSHAKVVIYKDLFDGTITDSAGTTFSDLFLLLRFDSGSMFSCLNESFEDDFLNATDSEAIDVQINRQYIIDILFNIFDTKDETFTQIDQIRFGIFVSRNYPKYPQFIRLSDSMANKIIDLLCLVGNLDADEKSQLLSKDAELGMLSLLSVYKPIDIEFLILKIEKAGLFDVLMTLYLSEEKYNDALNLWIKLQSEDTNDAINFSKPLSEILEHEFENGDKVSTIKLLHDNLELFVRSDLNRVAKLTCKVCPQVNAEVVNFKDSHLKFEYLKAIFNLTGTGEVSIDARLQKEFLRDLIRQRDALNVELSKHIRDGEEVDKSIKSKKQLLDSRIKTFVLSLAKLDSTVLELLKKNYYSILVDWYIEKNDFTSSTNLVMELFGETSENLINVGYSADVETKIWKLVELFYTIVSGTRKELQRNIGDLTLQESLLVNMIERAVHELSLSLQKEDTETKTIDSLKRVLQSIFQFTIDLSRDDSLIFSTILKKFLDRPCSEGARVGDIKFIMKEFVVSCLNTKQILRIMQSLINNDMFDDLEILDSLKLKGRSPRNIECETCGKKVWGGRVGNKVYEYWRAYMLQNALCQEESTYNGLGDLLIFKCKHTYHRKCIENMGMLDDETKECIVCKEVL